MYCSKCGSKLDDNFKYCTECGTLNKNFSLDDNIENLDISSDHDSNNIDNSVSNSSSTSNNMGSGNNGQNKDSTKWPSKLVIALIFGICGMIFGFMFSIITLILSIIGLVFAIRCTSYGSESIGVIIVNILGILSSAFGCFILGLIIYFCVNSDKFIDTYQSNKSSEPEVSDKSYYLENDWYCGDSPSVDSSNYTMTMSFRGNNFQLNTSSNYAKGTFDLNPINYSIYKYLITYTVNETDIKDASNSSYYLYIDEGLLKFYSVSSHSTYYCTTNFSSNNQL